MSRVHTEPRENEKSFKAIGMERKTSLMMVRDMSQPHVKTTMESLILPAKPPTPTMAIKDAKKPGSETTQSSTITRAYAHHQRSQLKLMHGMSRSQMEQIDKVEVEIDRFRAVPYTCLSVLGALSVCPCFLPWAPCVVLDDLRQQRVVIDATRNDLHFNKIHIPLDLIESVEVEQGWMDFLFCCSKRLVVKYRSEIHHTTAVKNTAMVRDFIISKRDQQLRAQRELQQEQLLELREAQAQKKLLKLEKKALAEHERDERKRMLRQMSQMTDEMARLRATILMLEETQSRDIALPISFHERASRD